MILGGEFKIGQEALAGLKKHTYATSSCSIIDNTYVLPLMWDTLERLVPRRFSPNALTLLGFVVEVAGFVPLVWYSRDLVTVRPGWMLGLTALCMFVYNTCDNMDGRHARALNMGSVIGEMFDHGLDSLTNVCQTLPVMVCCQAGKLPFWNVFLIFMLVETYAVLFFTRKLVIGDLAFVPVDTTELQYFSILSVLVTALTGPHIWDITVPHLGVSGRQVWVFLAVFSLGGNCAFQLIRQLSSSARARITREYAQTITIWAFAISIFYVIPDATQQPLPYFFIIAGMFSKLLTEIIFSNVGGVPPRVVLDSSYLAPLFVLCNYYVDVLPLGAAMWVSFSYSLLLWAAYFANLVYLAAKYLRLPVFTVPREKLT